MSKMSDLHVNVHDMFPESLERGTEKEYDQYLNDKYRYFNSEADQATINKVLNIGGDDDRR